MVVILMGPYSQPDIAPQRLTPVDVASLTDIETRAIVVLVAGHADLGVAGAVVDAARKVLGRTRCGEPPAGLDHLAATPGATNAEVAVLQAFWLGLQAGR